MRSCFVPSAVLLTLAALLLTAGAGHGYGQAFTASLTGLVTDPNNAVIPGATVKLRNTDTNEQRETTTGGTGRFTFSQLLPGPYELSVEAKGFKTFVSSGIMLRANQAAELNPQLQIGEIAERVEVVETAIVLDSQSANQSFTLNRDQVLNLPASTRTPFVMVHTIAGVTSMSVGVSQNSSDQNQNRFAFNGGRDMSGLVLIDGIPATAGDWGGLLVSPSVDSVQEVQVARNSYDAEFGKSGGGVVSMVTKGGSNEFHGTGYEFLRNDNLDANAWANNRNRVKKTEFQRNQFGGNLAGPIWRGKHLYFLGGYEGLREGSPATTTATVPTELQRRGDFSQSFNANNTLQDTYDPFTTRPNPAGSGFIRDPFPGNRIPEARFDKVGVNVLNLLPPPNTAPTNTITQANNFFGADKSRVNNNKFDARVDWAHHEKHTFYARVTKAWQERRVPRFYGTGGDTGNEGQQPRHHVTVGNTFIPNPSWVINVLVGSGRWREEQISTAMADGVSGTKIGLPASLVAQMDSTHLPQFNLSGFAGVSNGRYLNFPRETHNLQINNTRELGVHSVKFGFSGEAARLNGIDVRSADFNFDRGMTSGPAAQVSSSTTGNSIASLLLGTGASGSAPKTVTPATQQLYYGLYVQDTWRVTKRLTLSAGLRYETQRPRTERHNRYNWFDFNAPSPLSQRTGLNLRGGLVFVTPENRGQTVADNMDLAPRLGLAYKVTDKIVARAGYGIFYLQAFGNALQGGPAAGTDGFSTTTLWVSSRGGDGITPQDLISNPFPRGIDMPIGASRGLETQVGTSVVAWQRPHPTGYMQNYSLDIQTELAPGTVLEVGYSGNIGRKLNVGGLPNANQMSPDYFRLGAALDQQVNNPFFGVIPSGTLAGRTVPQHRLLRPHPQFVSVDMTGDTPGASSSFNAMFLKFSKQFSQGLSVMASYQFSKALDNASENQGWIHSESFRNVYDFSSDRSISAHDVPQSFVSAVIYDIPVGKGRKFAAAMPAVADAVLGGWQISTIVRLSSGLPCQLTAPNTLATYGFSIHRPSIASLRDLDVAERTPEMWFNTAAAKAPAPYTIGNAPRYMPNLRRGGMQHADLAILKNFQFFESVRAQLRGEFFNLTNSPQFGMPGSQVGASNFGQVTGTQFIGPRNVQLGLKVYF